MYADPAGIFLSENPIFQKKNAFLADFATGLSKIIKQNLSGGCLEGGPDRLSYEVQHFPKKGRQHSSTLVECE